MQLIFRFGSRCSRSLLHFRPGSIACTSRNSFANGSATAFVNDVAPENSTKNSPATSQIQLKKRPFTEDEQKLTFGKLVYQTAMAKRVYWCKTISWSTSITSILVTPYVINVALNDATNMKAVTMISIWTVFSSAFFFTPFLLDGITKKLVLEMYYNRDRDLYTAIFYNVFIKKRALQFRADDVRSVDPATVFLHTHRVGDHPLLIGRNEFRDEETRRVFAEALDAGGEENRKENDDDGNDEPAKSMADHHKRQQDQ